MQISRTVQKFLSKSNSFLALSYTTQSRLNNETLQPVSMAYASYESTSSEGGQPPPLLIMHGLFGSKTNWTSLCKAYHQKTIPVRKIIAVDARNHGDSPHTPLHSYPLLAEDIKAFLEFHGLKKVALLGHSMGGRAVMLFALKYPEFVEKLIVADISPVNTSPTLISMPALFDVMLDVKMPQKVSMSTARANVDKQLIKRINDKGLRQFLITNLIQKSDKSYAWRINIPTLVLNFKNNIAMFPKIEGQFHGPTLFLAGGSSDYIPKSDQANILNIFPNAKITYIEGAGHWLHSEKPAEFLTHTLQFLNKNGK